MAEKASGSEDRTETARRHDDRDIIEGAEGAPGGAGTSGHGPAHDVATRDELKRATSPDASVTRVQGSDKVQPTIPTRADHKGAKG